MSKVGLEEGWGILMEGITKAKRILEGQTDTSFTPEEYVKYYSCVYTMSMNFPDYGPDLYERYKWVLEQCIMDTVLPSLGDKHQEILLRVLVNMSSNYDIMTRKLSMVFAYLDRYLVERSKVLPLAALAKTTFWNMVWPICGPRVKDAVICLIDCERNGQLMDCDLVRNVMNCIRDVGYVPYAELEQAIIEETRAYYFRKASAWVLHYSPADYLRVAEDCLKSETDRLQYFGFNCDISGTELLQGLRNHLMSLYQNKQLQLQQSQVISQDLVNKCAGLTLKDDN